MVTKNQSRGEIFFWVVNFFLLYCCTAVGVGVGGVRGGDLYTRAQNERDMSHAYSITMPGHDTSAVAAVICPQFKRKEENETRSTNGTNLWQYPAHAAALESLPRIALATQRIRRQRRKKNSKRMTHETKRRL